MKGSRVLVGGSLCTTQIVHTEEKTSVSINTPQWPIHMQSEQGI